MQTYADSLFKYCEEFEGFRPVAEQDRDATGHPWTLGFGETLNVKEGDTITRQEATDRLRHRLDFFCRCVQTLSKRVLTTGQLTALTDFTYNLGPERLRDSTLLKYVNAGRDDLAAIEFEKWVYSSGHVLPGLVKRRHEEELWYQGETA